jgi:hypothetical protein
MLHQGFGTDDRPDKIRVSAMRDYDVRNALHLIELSTHQGERDTMVIDELGLSHGEALVDVAVINGKIHGYEIKSERDTLTRLPRQEPIYSAVLDLATLVVAEIHLKRAAEMVPGWWALKVAHQVKGGPIEFETVRQGEQNPNPDPSEIVKFLWREEALMLLEEMGGAKGVRGKSRFLLYDRICQLLSLEDICEKVRFTLKRRANWRPDALRT